MFSGAYRGAKILLTGDTGFKGSWLAYWLSRLGANVTGLALPAAGQRPLFQQAALGDLIRHCDGNIEDLPVVEAAIRETQPDLVIHMAAQAIVRESYVDPLGTLRSNVTGTAHVCDALRRLEKPSALVVVTSDKCYANNEWVFGYRENDPLGGSDPYSASKGMAELVTASWRKSFFAPQDIAHHRKAVASARAGNVIGPGDWATDRIVPDAVRAVTSGKTIVVRNPNSVRPWQHVLEPLSGYLALGAALMTAQPSDYCEEWNFGPTPSSTRCVGELADSFIAAWGEGRWEHASVADAPKESNLLRLAIDKAEARLRWRPVWDFETTIERTARGYRRLLSATGDMAATRSLLADEIEQYGIDAARAGAGWALSK